MANESDRTVKMVVPGIFAEEVLAQGSQVFQKMVFVYNAILSGWSVSLDKEDPGQAFVCTRGSTGEDEAHTLSSQPDRLKEFLLANLTTDNIWGRDVSTAAEKNYN